MTDSQTLTTSQTLARLWQVIRPNSGYLFLSILMSASVSAIMLFAMERVGAACDLILADAPASVFWPNALLLIVLFALHKELFGLSRRTESLILIPSAAVVIVVYIFRLIFMQ